MDAEYVMTEMKRGRGTQFDPEVLDAFLRLVEKGVINPNEIYAHRCEEIQQADAEAQEELARRVEEDEQIQAAGTQNDEADAQAEGTQNDDADAPSEEKGGAV